MRMSRMAVAYIACAMGTMGCGTEEWMELIHGNKGGGGRTFHVQMTGEEEAPAPGDPDGTGYAILSLNQGQGLVCFELNVKDIALPATAAHIHQAPAGEPGPAVVPLTPAPDETGHSQGCVGAEADVIKAIRKNPENYYVNVHNAEFPAGAVRGQLAH